MSRSTNSPRKEFRSFVKKNTPGLTRKERRRLISKSDPEKLKAELTQKTEARNAARDAKYRAEREAQERRDMNRNPFEELIGNVVSPPIMDIFRKMANQ